MPSHYHFYSLACSLFNFHNYCSLVNATSLLIRWERAISEHASLTLWAAAGSSSLPSHSPNTWESFCSLLALKWSSSKHIMKTKPFPPPMISSPLDSQLNQLLLQPPKSPDAVSKAAQLYPLTTKPMTSFANGTASPAGADISKRRGKLESLHSYC